MSGELTDITYIELSQEKSVSVYSNGDYENVIDEPITLREGDQLSLYKSFIDTREESSDRVIIDRDLSLGFSFMYYIRNWSLNWNPATVQGTKYYGYPTGNDELDNEDYIVCTNDNVLPPNQATLFEIEYGDGFKNKTINKTRRTAPFTMTIEYQDPNGVTQQANIPFPGFKIPPLGTVRCRIDIQLRCILNSVVDLTPRSLIIEAFSDVTNNKLGPTAQFFYQSDPSPTPLGSDAHFTPIVRQVGIGLPAGQYTPTGLAQHITTELTKYNGETTGNIPVTPAGTGYFMDSTVRLGIEEDITQSKIVCVDNSTGKLIYLPATPGDTSVGVADYIVGASQVALEYDVNDGLFTWAFLHTPMYVGNTGTTKNIGVQYMLKKDGNYQMVNKYAGIAFTSLTAQDAITAEPVDFWEGVLQFDLSKLCVQFQHVPPFDLDIGNSNTLNVSSTCLVNPLQDGVNSTGNLMTLDATVDKNSDAPFLFTSLNDNYALPSTVNGTLGITASAPYNLNITNQNPYFRIEVDCKAKTRMVGEKQLFRETMGIVSRYYEVNSFNNGTGADGLIYIHRGVPVSLSSFKIRITDDSGAVPSRLGEKNTVFLQCVRAIQQQQEEEENNDKK